VVALSRSAEQLIARHVDSVGTLDLLLLVHARRDRDWSVQELCDNLRCPDSWAADQIARLQALELLVEVEPQRYRFKRGRRHGAAVDEIARACRRDRAEVTRAIFARPARGRVTR
jgi:hypothetical protein